MAGDFFSAWDGELVKNSAVFEEKRRTDAGDLDGLVIPPVLKKSILLVEMRRGEEGDFVEATDPEASFEVCRDKKSVTVAGRECTVKPSRFAASNIVLVLFRKPIRSSGIACTTEGDLAIGLSVGVAVLLRNSVAAEGIRRMNAGAMHGVKGS